MAFNWQKLDWDSEFFGFKTGKITGVVTSENDLIRIRDLIQKNKAVLSYYFSQNRLSDDLVQPANLNIRLVDRKIVFSKVIDPGLNMHEKVDSSIGRSDEPKLIDLAIQSGIYSRFNIDPLIPQAKFEEMYRLWILNSIHKTLAEEVLVYRVENELAGFVTLGKKSQKGDIGIIAVDHNFRGKGIGKTLMKSAEKWFAQQGYTEMQVVTQGDNKAACALYQSCGFTVEKVEYVYHLRIVEEENGKQI